MNKNKSEHFSLGLIRRWRNEQFYFCWVSFWGQTQFLRQVQKAAKFCLSKNGLAFPFRTFQVCFLLFIEKSIQICGKTVEEKWKLVNSSLAATPTGILAFKGRACEQAVTFENSTKTTTRSLHLNWFPVFCFWCLGKPCKASLGSNEDGVKGVFGGWLRGEVLVWTARLLVQTIQSHGLRAGEFCSPLYPHFHFYESGCYFYKQKCSKFSVLGDHVWHPFDRTFMILERKRNLKTTVDWMASGL